MWSLQAKILQKAEKEPLWPKYFESSTSLENTVSWFQTTSLPQNEGQLCLAASIHL